MLSGINEARTRGKRRSSGEVKYPSGAYEKMGFSLHSRRTFWVEDPETFCADNDVFFPQDLKRFGLFKIASGEIDTKDYIHSAYIVRKEILVTPDDERVIYKLEITDKRDSDEGPGSNL